MYVYAYAASSAHLIYAYVASRELLSYLWIYLMTDPIGIIELYRNTLLVISHLMGVNVCMTSQWSLAYKSISEFIFCYNNLLKCYCSKTTNTIENLIQSDEHDITRYVMMKSCLINV